VEGYRKDGGLVAIVVVEGVLGSSEVHLLDVANFSVDARLRSSASFRWVVSHCFQKLRKYCLTFLFYMLCTLETSASVLHMTVNFKGTKLVIVVVSSET